MVEGENVVKWLYPGAESTDQPPSVSTDMESELQTDQSVNGSEMDSSPTSSGPELDTGSVSEELPVDPAAQLAEMGQKASNYVGNLLQSTSWYGGAASSSKEKTTETTDKNATAASTFSTSFFSSLGISGGKKGEEKKEEEGEEKEKEDVQEGVPTSASSTGFGYLSSAFSKIGLSGLSSSKSTESMKEKGEEEKKEGEETAKEKEEGEGNTEDFFSSAFSKVGKAASSYTKVIQETVYKAPMLADFNQEQQNFIKAKGEKEVPSAPWSGYQNEEELKEKILALSLDQRNFLRAPPSGVEFDMENSAVAIHALVLLKEDERLDKIRYELVPKQIKEEEFWRNYFYRVGMLKQSFELNNIQIPRQEKNSGPTEGNERKSVDEEHQEGGAGDHDDEFVSDSHQVSTKDLAEADEAMKKLGLDKEDADWEAELEGELEYEVVEGDADNPEWENQIQEMLEAEK